MKLVDLMEVHATRRPRRHEEQHCLRKRGYASVKDARAALLRLWKKGRPERSLYNCKYCGKYHLTSSAPGGLTHT